MLEWLAGMQRLMPWRRMRIGGSKFLNVTECMMQC